MRLSDALDESQQGMALSHTTRSLIDRAGNRVVATIVAKRGGRYYWGYAGSPQMDTRVSVDARDIDSIKDWRPY